MQGSNHCLCCIRDVSHSYELLSRMALWSVFSVNRPLFTHGWGPGFWFHCWNYSLLRSPQSFYWTFLSFCATGAIWTSGSEWQCYLWVVCSGQTMFDPETPHELFIELVAEFRPLICCQHLWQSHTHEDLQKPAMCTIKSTVILELTACKAVVWNK